MSNKLTFTLSALVALAAVTTGCKEESTSPQAKPPPANTVKKPATAATKPAAAAAGGDVAAGKKLFLTACANCHGVDGTGAMMRKALPKIGDLTSPEMHQRMSDEDIAKLVREGRNKMPAFGSMFKDDQIKALIAYVRTLKRS